KDELVGRSLPRVIRHAAERHRLVMLLERTALIDSLTDVYNRRGFELTVRSRLSAADRSNRSSMLLFIDVDGLKAINDTHGHEAGDAAIRTVATALRRSLRDSDIVGRVGGDEFAAWMDGATPPSVQSATARVDALLESAQRDAEWPFAVRVTIGATPIVSGDRNVAEVLARADQAMYAARADRGRQRLRAV
ncbi:MAG: GGDEF domain-containing protein, partial [Gemmatimonadaceae bacterium]